MRGTTQRTTTLDAVKTKRLVGREESETTRIYVLAGSPTLQERVVRGIGAVANWEIELDEPSPIGTDNGRGKAVQKKMREVVLFAATGGIQ